MENVILFNIRFCRNIISIGAHQSFRFEMPSYFTLHNVVLIDGLAFKQACLYKKAHIYSDGLFENGFYQDTEINLQK